MKYAVFAWHESPWYDPAEAKNGRFFSREFAAQRLADNLNAIAYLMDPPLPRGFVVRSSEFWKSAS